MPVLGREQSHVLKSPECSFGPLGVQHNLIQPKASAEVARSLRKGTRFIRSELACGFSNPQSAVTHVLPCALHAPLSLLADTVQVWHNGPELLYLKTCKTSALG